MLIIVVGVGVGFSVLISACFMTIGFGGSGFGAGFGVCALGFGAASIGFGVGALAFALSSTFWVGFFSSCLGELFGCGLGVNLVGAAFVFLLLYMRLLLASRRHCLLNHDRQQPI
jgi:hypothetical protein